VGERQIPDPGRSQPINIVRADGFSTLSWLIHGFSTRLDGVSEINGAKALNLGFTERDSRRAVEQNRSAFVRAMGAVNGSELWPLVALRQVHSDLVHRVEGVPGKSLTGDGAITDTPGLLLAVETADCLPIILVDPEHRAVGVFHAGWRGTLKRIVEKGVGAMRGAFLSEPSRMKAAIGPGIGACCYEVSEEVREKFESQFGYAAELFEERTERDPVREKYPLMFMSVRPPGHAEPTRKTYLDLHAANRRQLLDAGLKENNISALGLCTACRTDLFFSYRAEKGHTGRQMGVVGIRQ